VVLENQSSGTGGLAGSSDPASALMIPVPWEGFLPGRMRESASASASEKLREKVEITGLFALFHQMWQDMTHI
jgi:hypothetical protein